MIECVFEYDYKLNFFPSTFILIHLIWIISRAYINKFNFIMISNDDSCFIDECYMPLVKKYVANVILLLLIVLLI